MCLQDHPQPAQPGKQKKRLGSLRESMLKGSPFPKLHAKAAETKSMLRPVATCLEHFKDQDPTQEAVTVLMQQVLENSYSIDEAVDEMEGFKGTVAQGLKLEQLVLAMNLGVTKLCHHFHKKAMFLFQLCAQEPLPVSPY